MMASLVRPMATTKSGWGGESGAAPMPSMMRSSGNFSSWALCSATSSTRATTCTLPARLWVGAYRKVRRAGALQDERGRFRLVAIIEFGKQRLLARQCPGRPGAEREERVLAGAVRQFPARVLAGKARRDR